MDKQNPLVMKPNREQLFIEALSQCKTVTDAGRKAGYSEGYCTGELCRKLRNPKFMDKVKKYYNGATVAMLPKILAAESKVVQMVLDEPDQFPKFRQTIKELKQTAGVLQPDQSGTHQIINIDSVQNFMAKVTTEREQLTAE